MARHPTYYDQQGAQLIVQGVPIQDFMDGSSIRYRSGGDEATVTKGLDGATMNLSRDFTATIEFDLKETSSSNDVLGGLAKAQRASLYLDLTVVFIDGAGATHAGSGGAIQKRADVDTGGPSMGGRTWILLLPQMETDN